MQSSSAGLSRENRPAADESFSFSRCVYFSHTGPPGGSRVPTRGFFRYGRNRTSSPDCSRDDGSEPRDVRRRRRRYLARTITGVVQRGRASSRSRIAPLHAHQTPVSPALETTGEKKKNLADGQSGREIDRERSHSRCVLLKNFIVGASYLRNCRCVLLKKL